MSRVDADGRKVPDDDRAGQVLRGGPRGALVDEGVVFTEVRCARCLRVFHLCEVDYRGQIYCPECRRLGDRRSGRAANARHQASPEGQLDHRDAMRDLRGRRVVAARAVTDNRTDSLAVGVSSCVRDEASVPAVEAHALVAEGTDHGPNHGDGAAPGARDAAARDGGKTRGDAGDPRPDDVEPPSCGGDAARGALPVAPAGAVCCAVCGRWGLFLRTSGSARGRCTTTSTSRSSPTDRAAAASRASATSVTFVSSA